MRGNRRGGMGHDHLHVVWAQAAHLCEPAPRLGALLVALQIVKSACILPGDTLFKIVILNFISGFYSYYI